MAMTNNTTNHRWEQSITINKQSGSTLEIPGIKYLDQDMLFTIGVKSGSVTPAINSHTVSTAPKVTGSLSGTGTTIGTTTKPSGTDGTDYWAFTPSGTTTAGVSTANAKATVSAGWIGSNPSNSSNHTISITPTAANGTTRYIPKATMSGSVTNAAATTTVAPGSVTISTNAASVSGKTRIDISPTTTSGDISTYFLAYKANAAANTSGATSSISGSGKATIGTAGYMPANTTCSIAASGTATAKTSSKDSAVYYIPLPSAAISASGSGSATTTVAPGNVTIANNAATVSGKTRIDGSPTTATTGISTYFIAVKANAAANSTGSTSSISGTASASCGTAGWATTSLTGTGSVGGTATAKTSSKDSSVYYIPLTSAAISASGTGSATTTVAPGTVSITNNTTAVNGKTRLDATLNTNNSVIGTYYMAIQASAAANSTGSTSAISGTASAACGTAGWAPTTLTGTGSVSGTATAKTSKKDSSVYYIPLPTAAISASGTGSATTTVAPGTVSISNNTTAVNGKTRIDATLNTNSSVISTYYMAILASAAANSTGSTSAISGTASATCGTAGWAATSLTGSGSVSGTATAKTSKKDSSVYYIPLPSAAISASGTGSATTTVAPGNVTIANNTTAVTGKTRIDASPTTATTSIGTFYIALKANAAANSTGSTSSISGTASASCGTAGWATTSLTGSGSVSGTATAKTSSKDSSVYYIPVAAGTITNNTSGGTSTATINRGKQIKISAGYYSADKYYTAQSNSGTLTIDTSKNRGTISVDGYANVNVTGINIPTPSSGTNTFSVKVPNGSGTITFVFTVDTSGNVTVAES